MRSKDLRVRRSFSIVAHSPDVVELRSGVWNTRSFTLTDHSGAGKLFNLVSGLDGSLSRGDLAKREGVTRAEVEALVDHLDQLGAIEEGATSALDLYLEQVDALAGDPGAIAAGARILVTGDGALADAVVAQVEPALPGRVQRLGADDPLLRALDAVQVDDLGDGLAMERHAQALAEWRDAFLVDVRAVVDPLRSQVLNRVTLAAEIPVLYASVDGPALFVGPLVVPRRSACYECFETRVTMNLREGASYQRYKAALARSAVLPGESPLLAPVRALLVAHAALETVNFATTGSGFAIGKVLSVYLPTMEIAFNEVLRLPGCAACGSVAERDDRQTYFDVRSWLRG
jgi:bacteriocin biosynthesis cyclodehydratase domain-containing protein